jgi:hypothetical protein
MDVDDDDDRMSLSSISSGEEKLQVNPPTWPPSYGLQNAMVDATTQLEMEVSIWC